jgi:hypothetical protein
MNPMLNLATLVKLAVPAALFVALPALAQSAQEQLFARVLDGASCKKTNSAGLVCSYAIGDALSFSISDVGGNDMEISFLRSDANAEFFAAFASGCVRVLPGRGHAKTSDPVTDVYVSPQTGRVFRNARECHAGR